MDDQVVEEDHYSDDDLDALPDNAFHELEEDAFNSTQQPANIAQARLLPFKLPHVPGATSLAGGFGRLSVAPEKAYGQAQNRMHELSSDYGDIDDEMLDGEIFDAAEQPVPAATLQRKDHLGQKLGENTQREHWRLQRHGPSAHSAAHQGQQRAPSPQSIRTCPVQNDIDIQDYGQKRHSTPRTGAGIPTKVVNGSDEVNVLQAQVEKVPLPQEILHEC